MWVPVAGLCPRLALSILTGCGRVRILGSGVGTRKDFAQTPRRAFSDSLAQPLPCPETVESPSCVPKYRLDNKRYVTSLSVAETLAQMLQETQKPPSVILECNPGPGILTQALLKTGARVVALESERTFIPHLESIGKSLHGQLDVVHCDFFKLDPRTGGFMKPPVMTSQMLFQHLGIQALPWSAGIPFKIIGIFPIKSEKKALWKLIYDLYACTSIFKYGRVELNIFISEKEYQKLMARPKNPNLYQVLSVLWQVACDIKVLHTELWSSFDLYNQNGPLEKTKHGELSELVQQKLYFIRMTPRRNLFTENLTPVNYNVFFYMLKHCFGKRNAKIVDHLPSISPVDAVDILMQIRKHKNVKTINMCPEDFKHLFEAIECAKDYTYKWLCEDIMEDRAL
ncbi:dimethyladenosine transferase 2, mitochondrial [Tenrec ecaudatus]|uniref:dimethyladenosine transferase 2, mitochondrial n=1 Tax=Tenrec ecaudatus TaxID=94439 RepID=UPI003F5A851F